MPLHSVSLAHCWIAGGNYCFSEEIRQASRVPQLAATVGTLSEE